MSSITQRLICVLAVVCLPLIAGAQDKPQADLPVTRAVLFSSGVGYFEHTGAVTGNTSMPLNFKADQINDVLKSMVLMDTGGGNVTSVSYPSQEPVERALRSFGVDISGDPSLPELLDQLRGAKVVVQAPDNIAGSILSVETRTKIVGDPPTKIEEHLLTLVTDRGIRTVGLDSVQSLTLADPKLQQELNQALSLLVQSRDKDRKPVNIKFEGEGKRNVRIGYLVETPVWKTSYRLDLSQEKPLMQGWAIVENTSDSDWEDVSLSLVSGRPISFVMDLYTPMFVPRPEVKPELYASLQPRRYEGGIEAEEKIAELRQSNRRKGVAMDKPAAPRAAMADAITGGGALFAGRGMAKQQAEAQDLALDRGVQSVASAGDLGELFEYTLQHPISLARRRSAMLPIINQPIDAEKVSIYNQSVLDKHPLNGVWLTNDTGLKMLSGPVTVFDGGAYAGDAQIGHLAPNDKRLLSYAVDLAVTVDPSVRSNDEITAAKIVRGVLHISRRHTYEQTYTIASKAPVKRTIIIEHPFVNGRKLLEPDKAAEKTPQLYRFRVPLEANQTGKFTVKEEQPISQTIALLSYNANALGVYLNQKQIDAEVRNALAKAIQMKQQINALESKRNDLQRQLNNIQNGQDRLRKNIQTVGAGSTLGQRYLAKLSAEEDQIESLDKQIKSLSDQIEKLNNELADYLNKLNVG
ncbi:hypothetical protein HED60_00670 [Planctomycetales bacterium ZRK34]|nr:hypothetical protein HED60_00670 [Planctomycetales bacterium ZRK34]